MEVAWGTIFGHLGTLPPATDPTARRRAGARAWSCGRCAGRRAASPSPAAGTRRSVLAVATHVARREGLPDPVPVTRVFPDVPRVRRATSGRRPSSATSGCATGSASTIHDELDVVGPLATGIACASTASCGRRRSRVTCRSSTLVRGGSMIDGEGGDEVLGSAAHRVAPLARVARGRRVRCAGAAHRAGARCAAPSPVRARLLRRQWSDRRLPWLRAGGRDVVARRARPLMTRRASRCRSRPASVIVPRRRTQVLGRPEPRRADRAVRRAVHEPPAAPRRRAGARARGRVPRSAAIARRAAAAGPRPAPGRRPRPHQQGHVHQVLHGPTTPVVSPSAGTGRASTPSSSTPRRCAATWLADAPIAPDRRRSCRRRGSRVSRRAAAIATDCNSPELPAVTT